MLFFTFPISSPRNTVLFVDGVADVFALVEDVALLGPAVGLARRVLGAVEVGRRTDDVALTDGVALASVVPVDVRRRLRPRRDDDVWFDAGEQSKK